MKIWEWFRRQFKYNTWAILLTMGMAGLAMVVTIVSTMSWLLHGQVGGDFVLTGILAYGIVAPLLLIPFGFSLKSAEALVDLDRVHLDALFRTIPDLIWVKNPEGVYLTCNPTFERLYGTPMNGIVGKNDNDFVDPELAEFFRQHDRNAMEAKAPLINEEWLTFKADGYRGLFETIKTPIRDASGHLIGVLGVARDITERTRAAQALAMESEKNLALLRNASDGIHILDTGGYVTDASDSFCSMLGYRRDEVIGMHLTQWEARFDAAELKEALAQRLTQPGQTLLETLHRRRDGSIFEAEVSMCPLTIEGRQVLFCSSRDISDRKRLEHELQRSEENLARAQAIALTGSWTLDIPDNRLEWSDETYRIFALPLQSPINLEVFFSHIHPDDQQAVQRAWEAALGGAPYDIEHRILADGKIKWVHERARLEFDGSGQAVTGLGTVQDITEQKLVWMLYEQARERLGFALRGASDGLWDWNLETNEVYYSPRWKSMLGYDEGELANHLDTWKQVVHPDDRDQTLQRVSDYLNGKTSKFEIEFRLRHKDGHWVEVLSRARLACDDLGRPLQPRRLVGTHVDISNAKAATQALREREEIYRSIVSQAADAIVLIDPDSLQFVEFNAAAHTMLGYSQNEFSRLQLMNINPALVESQIRAKLAECIAIGSLDFETRHYCKDGHWRDVSVTNRPVQVRGRTYVAAIWHDLTAIKQIERGLKETTANLKQAQQIAKLGIWEIDLTNNGLEWSDELYRIAGIAPGTLVTMDTLVPLLHPDDREITLATWNQAVASAPSTYEIQHRIVVDGQVRWIHERAQLHPDEHGRLTKVIGTGQDITEQKLIEEKLRENEFFLRQSQQIGQIGGWRADPVRNTVMWTAEVYEMVGMPLDYQPDLETALDFYPPKSRKYVMSNLQHTLQSGEPFSIQTELRASNGQEFWVELRVFPYYAEDGHIDYLMGTIQNISAQRQAAEEKERLQAQLQQAQKMEAIGQLTGGIAHDFNNILAAILGYTGLALDRFVPDPQSKLAEYLHEVQKAGERARDLIAKMLDFSRAQAATMPKELEAQPLVHEVVKMLAPAIPASIDLRTNIDPATRPFLMDAVDLHQVLTNLIINARDAVGEQGSIEVALHNTAPSGLHCSACQEVIESTCVELLVRDTGHGIPADILRRIFDPFFTTKDIGKGSGMGLSVVHGLVHKHHGHIVVESDPAKGTVFRLLFPALKGTHSDIRQDVLENALAAPGEANILIVDDEAMLAAMLGELLEAHGYHPAVFTNSQKALAAFQADPAAYDAMITDQTMPGMTGDALIRNILRLRPDFPIILCTGHSNLIDRVAAEKLGVRRFFSKPVPSGELLAALADLLAENPARKSTPDGEHS